MNIWFFNHYALPPSLPGGTRHFDLALELVQRGHQVTIFASAFNHLTRQPIRALQGQAWQVENVDGVYFVWLPSYAYQGNNWRRMVNMLDYTWRAYWWGRQLPRLAPPIAPPQVIIGTAVHLFAVWAGYQLSQFYHARFLMEVRDLWPQTFLDAGVWREGQLQVRFFRWLEQFLYARAEKIITLSPLTQEYLARYSAAWATKTVYIPNGTRVARFQKAVSPPAHLSPPAPGVTRFMFIGSLIMTNGLDLALRAMRHLNAQAPGQAEWVFVGDGPERQPLEALAREWQLNNVQFVGAVPRAEVPAYAAQADCMVLIQREVLYGSTNKLFDYLATAKPIIFAVFAGHNNLAEEVGCGWVASPTDAEDLAAKMLAMTQLPPAERAAMGHRGLHYVTTQHDYTVLGQRLAAIIE